MVAFLFNRCLVLGGKGFIGSHLVEALLLQGKSVRVFDRVDADNLIPESLLEHVEFIDGDFSDISALSLALEGCEVCFHLISTTGPKTSNDSPIYDLQSNLLNTINFLELASKFNLKKIIFLSSGGTVYGTPKYLPIDERHPTDPVCSYGISKLAIEKYLNLYQTLYGIDYVVIRASNPYGERQRVEAAQGAVGVFLGKALSGGIITIWGDGLVARDYVYVGDLVCSLIAAMGYTGNEHVFNIGSGVATTVLELLATIEMVIGNRILRDYSSPRTFDVPINVLDISRAKYELCWSPSVSLHDGLLIVKSWLTK